MGHKIMNRGASQALYKYLPESWNTFYDKSTRRSYGTEVTTWYSEILQDINKKRLLQKIQQHLRTFVMRGGRTEGFEENITPDNFEIRKLACFEESDKPDILAQLQPKLFYCNKCHTIHNFTYKNNYESTRGECQVKGCNGYLKQINLAFVCECNNIVPVYPRKCKNKEHGSKYLKYDPSIESFQFVCSKCNSKIEIIHFCEKCNRKLYPRNAVQSANFIPFTVNMINLINSDEEDFIVSNTQSPKIVIGRYLDLIDLEKYNEFIQNKDMEKKAEDHPDFKQQYEFMKKMFNMSDEDAYKYAIEFVYQKTNNDLFNKISNFIGTRIIKNNDSEFMQNTSAAILEYYTILNAENSLSFDDAAKQSVERGRIVNTDEYYESLKRFGISYVQGSSPVPLINCVYGFTRLTSDPEQAKNKPLTLKALKYESGKRTIYGMRLDTEGILIEFDRKRIMNWMIKNNFINEAIIPNLDSEQDLKLWFINNIDLGEINPFSNIDKIKVPATHYIYTLLHTISHALIKNCSYYSGLDSDSLSEYILPNIPAIFIYCQNNQGITLGSLYSLLETYFNKWLEESYNSMQKCVFDPVCIEKEKACLGCLFINEVSCRHFNKDLNREYLIGNYDFESGNRIYGFWEEFYG